MKYILQIFLITILSVSCTKKIASSINAVQDQNFLGGGDDPQTSFCKENPDNRYCQPTTPGEEEEDPEEEGEGEGEGTDGGSSSGGSNGGGNGKSCEQVGHVPGQPGEGGHCGEGKDIPITFVFVNSSSKKLSNDAEGDALKAIDHMNNLYSHQGYQYIQFKLKEAIEVVDNTYHNTSCSNLQQISRKYGSNDSLVMLFVNDLSGGCAGVSFLWVFPSDDFSVTMAEYRYPFQQDNYTPVVHEFAHSMGLHHTANTYSGSTPGTGLRTFNNWISQGGRNSRRCAEPFQYYIHSSATNTSAQSGGVNWNSYHNTMYPSFGGKPDNGFFTEGYDYAMSWAFDCWYKFAEQDV